MLRVGPSLPVPPPPPAFWKLAGCQRQGRLFRKRVSFSRTGQFPVIGREQGQSLRALCLSVPGKTGEDIAQSAWALPPLKHKRRKKETGICEKATLLPFQQELQFYSRSGGKFVGEPAAGGALEPCMRQHGEPRCLGSPPNADPP